eukprot:ANDGO_08211.mRNA.1 Sensor histidine kinase RcsC
MEFKRQHKSCFHFFRNERLAELSSSSLSYHQIIFHSHRCSLGIHKTLQPIRVCLYDMVSVALLQVALEHADKALIAVSEEGSIIFANTSASDLFGFAGSELQGQNFDILICPSFRSAHIDYVGRLFSTALSEHHSTVHAVRKDLSEFTCAIDVLLAIDHEALCVVREVISQKESPQELRQRETTKATERVRSDFLARMGHELRTPLNAVLGTVESLLEPSDKHTYDSTVPQDPTLSGGQIRALHTIRIASESLLSLIVDILDFSAMNSDHGPAVQFTDFTLIEVIMEALRIASATNSLPHPGVILFVDPRLALQVRTDPVILSHVIIKIVSNILNFTSARETITMRIEEGSPEELQQMHIDLIPAPDCPISSVVIRMFDGGVFANSSASWAIGIPTSRQERELGLSRIIVERAIRSLGGDFRCVPPSDPSQKSEVVFFFPVAIPFRAFPRTWAELAQPVCGAHIVLLDADPVKHRAISEQLMAWKLRVSSVLDLPSMKNVIDKLDFRSCVALHVLEPVSKEEGQSDLLKTIMDEGASAASSARGILWTVPHAFDVSRLERPMTKSERTVPNPINPAELLNTITEILGLPSPSNDANSQKPTSFISPAPFPDTVHIARRSRVLVVDDNPVNLRVATVLLERRGCVVQNASNGLEAVKLLSSELFDLVFMDCEMPEMDGFEATRKIRAAETSWEHTPIIALSAHALESDRVRCLQCGMDDFISKPLNPQILTCVLARWSAPVHPVLLEQCSFRMDSGDQHNSLARLLSEIVFPFQENGAGNQKQEWESLGSRVEVLREAARVVGAQRLTNRCSWLLKALKGNDEQAKNLALDDLNYEALVIRDFAFLPKA